MWTQSAENQKHHWAFVQVQHPCWQKWTCPMGGRLYANEGFFKGRLNDVNNISFRQRVFSGKILTSPSKNTGQWMVCCPAVWIRSTCMYKRENTSTLQYIRHKKIWTLFIIYSRALNNCRCLWYKYFCFSGLVLPKAIVPFSLSIDNLMTVY